MKFTRIRIVALFVTLVLPILVACGGGGGTSSTSPSASGSGSTTSPSASSTEGSASASASTSGSAAASPSASGSAAASPSGSAGAGASGAAAVPANAADFLVYGNSGEPDNLDSMDTTSGNALVVTQQIEEPLIGRAEANADGDLSGLLATEWTPNDDSTEWTFTLREGVKFHDGTDFNADAVVFNFQRLVDPNFEYGFRPDKKYAIVKQIFGGFVGEEGSSWKSIEKTGDYEVKITLNRSFPLLPDVLSASYFGISSPDAVKAAGAGYGTPSSKVVGTGAFKFESWSPGQNIVLTRNDEYWGEKARMPGAVVRFIADAPARLAELQAGSVDFSTNLGTDARETLDSDANVKEVEVEPFNIAYLAMNFNSKPFDDVRVRQAIAHAINKEEILEAFYGGEGEVANTFLPASLSEFRPDDLTTYDYNPDRARELLAEAGYPDGFDTMTLSDGTETALQFWYMPVSRPYYPNPKPIAEAMQSYLGDVGINASLQTEDWGVYLDNVDAGNKNGMWMLGWTGDYGDPNNFLYTFFGPNAATEQGYNNTELISTLTEAGQAPSLDDAAAQFKEASTVIAQDVPRIPIVHSPPVYGAVEGLEGWTPSRYGSEPWKTLFVEK